MGNDRKDDLSASVRQALEPLADKVTEVCRSLPYGMSTQVEQPALRDDGALSVHIEKLEIHLTQNHNTVNNSGVAGIVSGGSVEGSSADVQAVQNIPQTVDEAFQGFIDGLKKSNLSDGQKQLLAGQVTALRDEAHKNAPDRDGGLISNSIEGLKLAAAGTEVGKALWDTFGDTITGFFT